MGKRGSSSLVGHRSETNSDVISRATGMGLTEKVELYFEVLFRLLCFVSSCAIDKSLNEVSKRGWKPQKCLLSFLFLEVSLCVEVQRFFIQ